MKWLLFTLLTLPTLVKAQDMYLTNFSGTGYYSGVYINVAAGGCATVDSLDCGAPPVMYWVGACIGAPGWYTYTCSSPIYSLKVKAHGLNYPDEFLQVKINDSLYGLTPANMTSYTECEGSDSLDPTHLAWGCLWAPTAWGYYNGGDFTIDDSCTGFTSFQLYCNGSYLGCSYTITIDTSRLAGTIIGRSAVCLGDTMTLYDGHIGGTWSCSNTHASISSTGFVNTISQGIDTIRYSLSNSCGIVASMKIISVDTPSNAGVVSGYRHVCLGNSDTLHETIAGGVWSTSGAINIVVPSSEYVVIQGTSVGVGVVSYSYSNGCGSADTSYSVTVAPLPDAGLISTIWRGVDTVCKGDSIKLGETVPNGVWSSSDNTVATVNDSGVVFGVNLGYNNIIYTVISGDYGCRSSTDVYFYVRPCTTGTPELSEGDKDDLKISPNPTQNELNITASYPIRYICITNLLGQTLYFQHYNSPEIHIDVAALPTDMYLVRINGIEVRKFIKQ